MSGLKKASLKNDQFERSLNKIDLSISANRLEDAYNSLNSFLNEISQTFPRQTDVNMNMELVKACNNLLGSKNIVSNRQLYQKLLNLIHTKIFLPLFHSDVQPNFEPFLTVLQSNILIVSCGYDKKPLLLSSQDFICKSAKINALKHLNVSAFYLNSNSVKHSYMHSMKALDYIEKMWTTEYKDKKITEELLKNSAFVTLTEILCSSYYMLGLTKLLIGKKESIIRACFKNGVVLLKKYSLNLGSLNKNLLLLHKLSWEDLQVLKTNIMNMMVQSTLTSPFATQDMSNLQLVKNDKNFIIKEYNLPTKKHNTRFNSFRLSRRFF